MPRKTKYFSGYFWMTGDSFANKGTILSHWIPNSVTVTITNCYQYTTSFQNIKYLTAMKGPWLYKAVFVHEMPFTHSLFIFDYLCKILAIACFSFMTGNWQHYFPFQFTQACIPLLESLSLWLKNPVTWHTLLSLIFVKKVI